MGEYVKFAPFASALFTGLHRFDATGDYRLSLVNVEPNTQWATYSDLQGEVSNPSSYPAGGIALSMSSTPAGNGLVTVTAANVNYTSVGGNTGPFRYGVIHGGADREQFDGLVMYWDLGETVTLENADNASFSFSVEGLFQIGY